MSSKLVSCSPVVVRGLLTVSSLVSACAAVRGREELSEAIGAEREGAARQRQNEENGGG